MIVEKKEPTGKLLSLDPNNLSWHVKLEVAEPRFYLISRDQKARR